MTTIAMQDLNAPAKTGAGDFVWFELRTADAKNALDFYTHVVGWQAQDAGMPGAMPYTLFSADGRDVAGMMQLQPEMTSAGLQPGWMGFIGVDDVDAYAQRVEQAGGKVNTPPQDIPGVGRFAAVADPQGAPFLLFKASLNYAPPRPPMGAPGSIGWCELSATDGPAAWSFYSDVFGWKEDTVMDMGAMGIYRIFNHGGPQLGAVMTRDASKTPGPFWLFYLCVDEIDAAAARITEKQGQICMGPHEVPGALWIIVGTDPQGSLFALVGPKGK